MRARRIKTGFHRIGIVGAVACVVAAAVSLAYAPFRLGSPEALNDTGLAAGAALGWLIVATLFYVVMRALGWIIAGFAGD
jgi:hypothetical protein